MSNSEYLFYRYSDSSKGMYRLRSFLPSRIPPYTKESVAHGMWTFLVRFSCQFCICFFLGIALCTAYSSLQVSFARDLPDSFSELAEDLLPAVVNISTSQMLPPNRLQDLPQFPPGSPFEDFFREFFDRNSPNHQGNKKATSLGSGFIIDKDGFIVTNNHVIQDADEINITLSDDTSFKAEVVGRDKKVDLALLKITAKDDLPFVRFGDSDEARVGDWVMAIGNPLGLGGSVTVGIISAKTRDINAGPYDSFIQTDAAINRGNSGGAIV